MKDFLKGILSLTIAFIIVAVGAYYYVKLKEKNDNTVISEITNTANELVKNEVVEEEQKISDTDEIETYNNEKARCTTNLNFRKSPSSDSEKILTIPKNTVFDVVAKIRNRLV